MAKYQGRTVKLNKPFRTPNQRKKFAVYVRDKKTKNVKKVRFGDPNMSIKKKHTRKAEIISCENGRSAKTSKRAKVIVASILVD